MSADEEVGQYARFRAALTTVIRKNFAGQKQRTLWTPHKFKPGGSNKGVELLHLGKADGELGIYGFVYEDRTDGSSPFHGANRPLPPNGVVCCNIKKNVCVD